MKCINKCNCLELTENKKNMRNFHLYPIQEISFYTQYRKFPSKMYQIGNILCTLYKSHSPQGLVYMLYYSIQHYVIKFVIDLRHDGGFLPVLQFLPPKKLTATI